MTSRLLICTVGGSPEPIVATLKHWRPVRVRFVHTKQTKSDIEARVIPMAREEGFDLDPGRYDTFELTDGQNLASCLDQLRLLTPEVTAWTGRGPAFEVVVDITGGTKCMSAAIGIQASRWPCVFSYVGGRERTKDGVGVVVSGTEITLCQGNPWNSLGHRALEDFVVLFDQHAFLAAANVAVETLKHVGLPDRKREFAVLENLARAFDAWDRFDHNAARNLLDTVAKSANDLRAVLGQPSADRLLRSLADPIAHISAVCDSEPPCRHHVLDLLANAKRRRNEGRFDDAVARLYRATEAIAQVALKERYQIDSTEKVPLTRIPDGLRQEWASRTFDDTVPLGLQDSYRLLSELGDPMGRKFTEAGLAGERSPLTARNRSILAHGFSQVSDNVYRPLWKAVLQLADVDDKQLPSIPILRYIGTGA